MPPSHTGVDLTLTSAPADFFLYLPLIVKNWPPSTPIETPTTTPCTGYDGNWSGMTSQNLPISFTVQNYVVTSLTVEFKKEGFFTCTYSFTHSTDTPITGSTFQMTGQKTIFPDGSIIYTITGTFNPDKSASGTLQMTVDDILCNGDVNGTWTATKQ